MAAKSKSVSDGRIIMAICPVHSVELTQISLGVNPSYECPAGGEKYIGWGLMGLLPMPSAVVSAPPEGFKEITNTYVEPTTGKLIVIHKQ